MVSFATSRHYSPPERAALAFAEARRHFSEAQVVELTAAVALENFRSKFNVALGIESQGFCIVR